ncbi:M20/M25/M40 family metallo-hydrolase [Peribacillus muralis]|uniref:M20/M25/M40 family metallo-hydrolase n=1 Tax=Peribacillus muralis TaxID=264697 RepID=UPI001F4E46D9|nr:M20/M25/M40 family metallo-hydrolase [Peribacillus muralis]MCK1991218.1 M20/M25/M40 family metallo-hydrolase [Peribacillus muralis]MCK2011772.1 M20/M25/M40 family metallo-hydrolase [Peribacillus muralis]
MDQLRWGTPETLRALLCELVSWESTTLSEGECTFPFKVQEKLGELDFFKKNPDNLSLHGVDLGRHFVNALYKHPEAEETIVLISHFDTVQTEEYGDLEVLAFQPEQLTSKLHERKDDLPEEARIDLESGKYLFGRGTMDMKMGLALHMALIEKASMEGWPINLMLVTVPDEEVNSAGMRAAVKELVALRDKYGLTYKMFLNSEPSFSQKPGDERHYIYSGTMGKIMPAALFYGKETHVGEPLKGMTANYMASFLTQLMEWNPSFLESDLSEETPLPVSLQQKDLKLQYSTQTPYRAAALYNVFIMKRSAADIMDIFEQVAEEAATTCNETYKALCRRERIEGVGEVQVLRYEKLLSYAVGKFGEDLVEQIKGEAQAKEDWDEREKSLRIVEKLMIQCQELAPAIVLLFAPPYYPAVNTSDDPQIIASVQLLKETARLFNEEVHQIHYFNGLCDLSYVQYKDESAGWTAFEKNTPVWGDSYSIPFADMLQLQAPVLNVGPFGKDAHQRTERLHIDSAFIQTPFMLERLIRSMVKVPDGELKETP